ncbi:MAG TPA: NAD-dependent epimerase/dehydratase family protein [Microthrixaceae bacterium]|nr:NAD-dependent epimerase/dehydratase family protein [Microthrixaceae bacterium]
MGESIRSAVLVSGGQGALGRKVRELAARGAPSAAVGDWLPDRRVVADATGDPSVDLVLLAAGVGPDRDGSTTGGVDLAGARELLADLDRERGPEGAAPMRVESLVVLSSAMVYGAWADNPVPLSEDRVLRPNPSSTYALEKAELERLAADFARDHPDVAVAVLRPTVTTSGEADGLDWMARSLWHVPTARHGEHDPPAQFLHIDDLASAIDHARRNRLRGAFNVAPEGWISSGRQIELAGRGGRVRIPEALAGRVARSRWRLGLTSTPPEVLAYTMYPWVIATDRLRSTGWQPRSSNDEAFVLASRSGWWSSLSARRRQEMSLAGMGVGAVASVAAILGVVVRVIRTRRRRRS